MSWWLKLRKRRQLESDLAEEIAFHRERRQHDSDAPPFGNPTLIREQMRDQWTFAWIETTLRDTGYALRGFRRNPGFAISAIGSLALGIAAVIAIFTAADDLLFRPLPYRDPARLVMVWESNRTHTGSAHNVISPGNFVDWKSRNRVFEEIAAFSEYPTVLLDRDRSEQLRIQSVSANFFRLLGVNAYRGRLFTEAEDLASAHADSLVIISYRLWQNWFGGAPDTIGRRVLINSLPRTIIGVMPPDFHFRNRDVDLWDAIGIDPAIPYRTTHGRYMMAVARFKRDVSFAQAQAQMTDLARAIETENPVFDRNWTVVLEPLRNSLVRDVRTSLLALLGAVGLLLAIACSNASNLLLARYASRRAELAVRTALGAGRGRLIRQLLTESLLLATAAGALGIVAGRFALAGLVALAPESLTQTAAIEIDWRILLFAVGLSGLTGILFGLVPSLIASRSDVAPELKRANRWGTSRGIGARALLIAGEVAASVILLAGAGLLFSSLVRLQGTGAGLNARNLLTFRFALPASKYKEPNRRTQLFARAIERIGTLPGVRSASAVSYLPFNGMAAGTGVTIASHPPRRPGEDLVATIRTVMPRYFETMGIPVRRGRDFTAADNTPGSPMRFIVSEAFVRKYMPNEEPLGKSINAEMDRTNPFGEIIGVAGDVKEGALDKEPVPTVYYIHSHLPYTGMILVVRTMGDPLGAVAPVRRIMHELDPALPVADVRTMETILGETYARERFSTLLLGGFSIAALVLAAIGIYGVLAYSVAERTREIGVRLAMGAGQWRIVRMVLNHAARFVVAGLLAGMAGAFAASKLIESLLFETGVRDPVAFTLAPGVLLGVALVAAYIPARRAARLDPMRALRVD